MARVGVAADRHARVVDGPELERPGPRARLEAHEFRVELAAAEVEGPSSCGGGPQELVEVRDRAVVEERGRRPDAVQRPGPVALAAQRGRYAHLVEAVQLGQTRG